MLYKVQGYLEALQCIAQMFVHQRLPIVVASQRRGRIDISQCGLPNHYSLLGERTFEPMTGEEKATVICILFGQEP